MNIEKVKKIFNAFHHTSEFLSFKELNFGHINDTFLIITKEKPFFVLQKTNNEVFKDVPELINNKVMISNHVAQKLHHLSEKEIKRKVLTFVPTKEDQYYFKQSTNSYWSLMYYIDESCSFETVTSKKIAFEAGKLIGEFLNLTSDFDVSRLKEVIPNFHQMSSRYAQFYEAEANAYEERLLEAKKIIDLVHELKEEMHIIENLKNSGKFKVRVTHNDLKISNILFSKDEKGLCVIDTDTIMPGIVHFDFGDAIRTICNTAAEDEIDLSLVEFNIDYYKAFKEGFLAEIASSLNNDEIEHLALACKTMIFIMGLRFLTDYLNNDVYYKTSYANHNLNRAKNQFRLLESFNEKTNLR